MRRALHTAVAALALAGLVGASVPAQAEFSPPPFDGTWFFVIESPSDPEEFSREVQLGADQELQLIDSQHATVYYTDSHEPAFGITATPAHDAAGATVPTSLAVSDGNVLTLTAHHRAGNPLAAGAPFDYPVRSGEGLLRLDQGVIVPLPLGILESSIVRSEFSGDPPSRSPQCLVPKLTGRPLAASRKRLGRAGCKVGQVSKRKGAAATPGRVIDQRPKAGTALVGRAKVDLILAG